MKKRIALACLVAAVAAAPIASASADEIVLRIASSFPRNLAYTKSFVKFTEIVNAKMKGKVRAQFLGGPEVVPAAEQLEAVRSGTLDAYYGPLGQFSGSLPEGGIVAVSNLSLGEMRQTGAMDLLNQILAKKANARLIGVFATGNGFHFWLTKEPKFKADGSVDFTGLKIRGAPGWRGIIQHLGGTIIVTPAVEVYSALERGVVDGTGWTVIGVRDFNWNKFVKYRIDPPWNSSDTVFVLNLDTWKRMAKATQDELQALAIAYEAQSRDEIGALRASEEKALIAGGLKIVDMKGAGREAYLRHARDLYFEQAASRDKTNIPALREKFVK
ncbi:MAG: TRAP transporter substrate-binding protein DctP [Rhodospirillaceae bacterium]|nr:TRAP transporter substrate-binding protein DctP [Rhodospirillaceae bacterium]